MEVGDLDPRPASRPTSGPPGSSHSASRRRTGWPSPDGPVRVGGGGPGDHVSAGAATTTVHPTSSVDDVAYIVDDSDSKVVFAEDMAQVEKLRTSRTRLPGLLKVVVIDGEGDGEWVMTAAELAQRGADYLRPTPASSTTGSKA